MQIRISQPRKDQHAMMQINANKAAPSRRTPKRFARILLSDLLPTSGLIRVDLRDSRAPENSLNRRTFVVNKLSRIQNPVGIESLFQAAMHLARNFAGRSRPPAFFGEANSVLARDHAAPCKHLLEQIIEGVIDLCPHGSVAVVTVCHDIDMNIAVTSMAEAGDWKSMFGL